MLMTRVKKQTIFTEKTLFMCLASLCMVLFALYIYFVSASVLQVVIRTESNQEITKVSSSISELEGKYIAAQHKVSSEIASLQGYDVTSEKIFIDRTKDGLALSNGARR